MQVSTGALARSGKGAEDAIATVELQTLERTDGGIPTLLLAVVCGDYATPALESVKDAFACSLGADLATAKKLVETASPPLAPSCAVALVSGHRLYTWASGSGRVHLQRTGSVRELPPGEHDLVHGDVVAVVTAAVDLKIPWLVARHLTEPVVGSVRLGVDPFRNDGLDDPLALALAQHRSHAGPLGVALAWVGYAPGP